MALNLKNAEVERLAAEVASLTGESKTEAIRRALLERRRRLKGTPPAENRARVLAFLQERVWPTIPADQLGRRLTRADEDEYPRLRAGWRVTLDSSALVAILFSEPGFLDLVDCILEADTVRVGAPTLVETGMVLAGRRGSREAHELDELVNELAVTIVPFGEAEWRVADHSLQSVRTGTPQGGPELRRLSLLRLRSDRRRFAAFVGDDFGHTDIVPAM